MPVGSTVSYTDIAIQVRSPKSVRAVAGACAAKKLAVAIPCHRAVRLDGSLSGYRWGIGINRELLKREADAATNKLRCAIFGIESHRASIFLDFVTLHRDYIRDVGHYK
ncbi:methylated-DNA--[protein]-cysteine S-methyltransferase [Methyloglobulus sp.]|uniref:methylated-DNA--[protein]-cysteine S-methyltransferase n=1 Tax=Methyloglobulus sp. TaxID=2518622 RepID=UPI0039896A0C